MTKFEIIEYALKGAREDYRHYINEQQVAEGTQKERFFADLRHQTYKDIRKLERMKKELEEQEVQQ